MAKKAVKKTAKKGNITPLGDRVFIEPEEGESGEKKSAAGIIIPAGTNEERVNRGKVVALGEGRIDSAGELVPMKVSVGNKVIYKWSDKVKIDGKEYDVVSASEILAIIK